MATTRPSVMVPSSRLRMSPHTEPPRRSGQSAGPVFDTDIHVTNPILRLRSGADGEKAGLTQRCESRACWTLMRRAEPASEVGNTFHDGSTHCLIKCLSFHDRIRSAEKSIGLPKATAHGRKRGLAGPGRQGVKRPFDIGRQDGTAGLRRRSRRCPAFRARGRRSRVCDFLPERSRPPFPP